MSRNPFPSNLLLQVRVVQTYSFYLVKRWKRKEKAQPHSVLPTGPSSPSPWTKSAVKSQNLSSCLQMIPGNRVQLEQLHLLKLPNEGGNCFLKVMPLGLAKINIQPMQAFLQQSGWSLPEEGFRFQSLLCPCCWTGAQLSNNPCSTYLQDRPSSSSSIRHICSPGPSNASSFPTLHLVGILVGTNAR